jgi:hypothetical protein
MLCVFGLVATPPPWGVYLMLGIHDIPTIRYSCLCVKYLLTLALAIDNLLPLQKISLNHKRQDYEQV